ncbi:MAG: hypothetical protein ACKVI6_05065 [Candidatus Poseidoniales archaeon]|jgi:hypothetical protein|tara:strand:+ start:894 stop:2306 length:1413 start_codon:yes stop_codon:yes gene_type:complete
MDWLFGPYEFSMGALILLTLPIHLFLTRGEPDKRVKLRDLSSEIREKKYWWHIGLYLIMFVYKAFIDHHNEPIKARVGGYTHWIYSIEGDWTHNVQEFFLNDTLTELLSIHYLFMYLFMIWFSPLYYILSRDQAMADKSALNYFVIYLLSVPLYLFFNIEVTSSYLEGMDALLYHDSFTLSFFTSNDPMDNAIPSLHIGLPISLLIINRLHCYDLGIKIREWRHREFDIFVTINILIYLFSIQYLGIHWVIDIPSGIIIAIFTSYFVHKFQPLLRSVNLNGISSLIPKKRQLYAISIAMILCLTTITFGIIDGIGTNEENPNFRVGKGDVNLETIEVHSLSKPVAVEILNVGDTQIEILLIKRSYVEKYTDKGLFEWDKFATNGELMTLYPGQIVNFEVNTTSLFDAYLLLIRLSNSQDCEDCLVDLELGEVRITSNYVDDELLWTAILSSLPSFCIIGYVLGSINQKEI